MQFTYEYAGENYTIQLDKQADGSYLAKIGDETFPFTASSLPDGASLIQLAAERHIVHSLAVKEMRYVQVNAQQYALEKITGRKRRAGASSSAGDLKAEMPGQVIDLRVTEGDTVELGQVLMVLEAMKMEIRITAPYKGTVAKLSAKKGDLVERGQILVEVQAEES